MLKKQLEYSIDIIDNLRYAVKWELLIEKDIDHQRKKELLELKKEIEKFKIFLLKF